MHDDSSSILTIAQCNVYRYVEGHYEFLLLKRIDDRKPFWQPVTEPVQGSEDIGSTLKRGLHTQAGIVHVKKLSEETYSYEWYSNGQRGRDIVFAVEVHNKADITLDTHAYLDYDWFTYENALDEVKWEGNKEALRRLKKRLDNEPRLPEIELNTHDAPVTQAPTHTVDGQFVSQVRHDELPEPPDEPSNTYGLL